MGKGSGTSVNNVTKRPQRLSGSEPAGGAGSTGSGAGVGGDNPGTTNVCLLKFTGRISIDTDSPGLRPSQVFTLVQGNNAYLDVLSGGVVVGSFNGEEQALLEGCMAQGYVYKGIVDAVSGKNAICSIKGYGVQNEPANNS